MRGYRKKTAENSGVPMPSMRTCERHLWRSGKQAAVRLTVAQAVPIVPDQLLARHRVYLLTSARLTTEADQRRTRRPLAPHPSSLSLVGGVTGASPTLMINLLRSAGYTVMVSLILSPCSSKAVR